ncbi:MAG: hypothetical protein QOJ84_2552 [Bradyrhizobium sp.]|jgi:hypothetical protein|nr:hypothetical protein [Bradyrhizobium sp.]
MLTPFQQASFRDTPLRVGPESILSVVVMDSGLALRAPRNDDVLSVTDRPNAVR